MTKILTYSQMLEVSYPKGKHFILEWMEPTLNYGIEILKNG